MEYNPRLFNHARWKGETAIFIAVSHGHIDTVELLLEPCYHCDINKANKKGETPLIAALRKNHVYIARLLLSKVECEVSKESNNHESAITWAYKNNQKDIVSAIIDHPTNDVNQSFNAACQYGDIDRARHLLISSHFIEINKVDLDGNSPLFKAVKGNHLAIIKKFMYAK